MAGAASSSLKDVTLELGGKSPLIVLDDADLDRAADIAMAANFFSSGQVCTNGTRVFVPASVKSAFESRMLERVDRIRWATPSTRRPISGRSSAPRKWIRCSATSVPASRKGRG